MSEIPERLNSGPWVTAYTAPVLTQRIEREPMVLPICSLGTPASLLATLGPLVLPPLYHEALTPDLKQAIIRRIDQCLPYYEGSTRRRQSKARLQVVELPAAPPVRRLDARVVAFSVDTAVEQHGPHLPLATDRIQSYAVLQAVAEQVEGLHLAPPADYGHLAWGLAHGLSADIPPSLLVPYLTGYINAVAAWFSTEAVYVVDVHGSAPHRAAIAAALAASRVQRTEFRWLHEPLKQWVWDAGDAHAGGAETAIIEYIRSDLVDPAWWPGRAADLRSHQMPQSKAMELAKDLPGFIAAAESSPWNGIVGKIENYDRSRAAEMMSLAVSTAVEDVRRLLTTVRRQQ